MKCLPDKVLGLLYESLNDIACNDTLEKEIVKTFRTTIDCSGYSLDCNKSASDELIEMVTKCNLYLKREVGNSKYDSFIDDISAQLIWILLYEKKGE